VALDPADGKDKPTETTLEYDEGQREELAAAIREGRPPRFEAGVAPVSPAPQDPRFADEVVTATPSGGLPDDEPMQFADGTVAGQAAAGGRDRTGRSKLAIAGLVTAGVVLVGGGGAGIGYLASRGNGSSAADGTNPAVAESGRPTKSPFEQGLESEGPVTIPSTAASSAPAQGAPAQGGEPAQPAPPAATSKAPAAPKGPQPWNLGENNLVLGVENGKLVVQRKDSRGRVQKAEDYVLLSVADGSRNSRPVSPGLSDDITDAKIDAERGGLDPDRVDDTDRYIAAWKIGSSREDDSGFAGEWFMIRNQGNNAILTPVDGGDPVKLDMTKDTVKQLEGVGAGLTG
jgi:hypothetical protein